MNSWQKKFWIGIGAFGIAFGIVLSVFATHVLKAKLNAHSIELFEKANFYFLYNALGILVVALNWKWENHFNNKMTFPLSLIFTGVLIFSFSLYGIALGGEKMKFLGAIAPVGGLEMIIGWIWTGILLVKN